MEVEEPNLNSLPAVPQSFRGFFFVLLLDSWCLLRFSLPRPPGHHPYGKIQGDPNVYTTGRRGETDIVLVLLAQIGEESLRSDWSREPPNSSSPKLEVDFVIRICYVVPPYVDSQEVLLGQRVALPGGRRAARPRRTAPSPVSLRTEPLPQTY